MNKSIRTLILIIGILSVLAGIFAYFYRNETTIAYLGIFIGITLVGSIFLPKSKNEKD